MPTEILGQENCLQLHKSTHNVLNLYCIKLDLKKKKYICVCVCVCVCVCEKDELNSQVSRNTKYSQYWVSSEDRDYTHTHTLVSDFSITIYKVSL